MDKADLIILFSGGADSTVLVEMAIDMGYTPYCLIFDYGQIHKQEIDYAIKYCTKMNLGYSVVRLNLDGISSALTDGTSNYEGVSEWHVPSRNLIFISYAASLAESKGVNLIWYGANYGDRENRFPDCYQEWVYKLNQLLKINGSMEITVEAPLLGMTKASIEKLLQAYNINKSDIFSGYGREK